MGISTTLPATEQMSQNLWKSFQIFPANSHAKIAGGGVGIFQNTDFVHRFA